MALKRSAMIKIGVVVVGLAALATVALLGLPLRAWLDALMAWLRGLGPVAFLGAMVLLPAFGFPMFFFSGSAGSLFSAQLGWPGVIALIATGLAGNLALSYWLARYAFRPLLTALITRLGYKLPEVEREDELGLAVLVRVTPGPPFFAQSYLLGLAEVRFWLYLGVSWGIAMVYSTSLAVFGDALLQGKGKIAFLCISVLVAVVFGVKFLRRHFERRRKAASTL